MEIVHNQKEPVIILGHARSGTSILGDLLRKYLRISFGPESQFLIRFYKLLPRYGDLTQEKNLSRLLHDVLQERCFQRWQNKFGYSLDEAEIFSRIQEPGYKGIVYAVFHYLAQCGGMQRWGDKTPMYNLHLDIIQELFPDSRYIHMVRDGRDVALSVFQTNFGSRNVYNVAGNWNRHLQKVHEFRETLPGDQFLEMRYEELMQDPARQLTRLIPFLDVHDPDQAVQQYIQDNIEHDLKKNNFDKWKTRMSGQDIFLFETIARDWLRAYDYELKNDGNLPDSLPAWKRFYWEVQDKRAKIMDRESLQDNVYKLKTRMRHMLRR